MYCVDCKFLTFILKCEFYFSINHTQYSRYFVAPVREAKAS